MAEGFATAASVHQATGKPVVVAFDAGNLKAVSEKLIGVLPENVPVYFAADQDPSQTGLHKAQAAAEVWGDRVRILMPEFSEKQIAEFQDNFGKGKIPTDFNDLHKLAGIDAVRKRFDIGMEHKIDDFRQPETEFTKPKLSREARPPRNEEVNPPTLPATSAQDVAVSFSEKENVMTNQDLQQFKLGQAVKHQNPHLTEVSLVVGKSSSG